PISLSSSCSRDHLYLLSFPTRRSSDLLGRSTRSNRGVITLVTAYLVFAGALVYYATQVFQQTGTSVAEGWYLTTFLPVEALLFRSEEHTSELQSRFDLVCRLLLEKKNK